MLARLIVVISQCLHTPVNCDDANDCTKDLCINGGCVHLVEGGYYIPNAFTPDGDGNNDFFLVYGNDIEKVELKVFNRWGELVFESTDLYRGWDGTYHGKKCNPAVFVYIATITRCNGIELTDEGSITLIR